MSKLKVLTVVGTRPEVIRLSRVINNLDKNLDNILVHTGQNYDYELNQIFFKELNIKHPKYQIAVDGNSPIQSISQILKEVDKIIIKEKPDAFLVLGDTNSCLSAYAAKRSKIPIFHIESGNRCYDERVPEEVNRKIIDHLSDINITYSNIAKENLLRENISPDKVFKIGSPLYEIYYFYQSRIKKSKILNKLKIKKRKYYLLSVHREENIDDPNNFKKFLNLLLYFDKKNDYKVIVSAHPRTMKKINKNNINKFKNIIFHKPFSYFDYSNLQLNAKVVLSDSGSITEESNIMNFDAINLRSTNERQEGMQYGAVPMSHFVIEDIARLIKIFENKVNKNEIILDYKFKNFSKIFLNILISYINYIKEYTWKKKI